MVVTISLEFRSKLNPQASDPPPFDTTNAIKSTLAAAEAADYLEKVASAIRDRRLYGFMLQGAAEGYVGAGDWIEETAEEAIAEARTKHENAKSSDAND